MTFRFGRFSLDSRTRQLLRDEAEVGLSPKAFHLLLLLVENRSRAMSRDELQQQLWPSTFVLETNLAGLIAEVRRALRDRAERPTFVRTMHRFGYRFIGDVDETDASPAPEEPAMKYWLVWETRQVPLAEGNNLVGRGVDASVWIDAPGVSRHHARIVVSGGAATLEDLGSKNGTVRRWPSSDEPSSPRQWRSDSFWLCCHHVSHPGPAWVYRNCSMMRLGDGTCGRPDSFAPPSPCSPECRATLMPSASVR